MTNCTVVAEMMYWTEVVGTTAYSGMWTKLETPTMEMIPMCLEKDMVRTLSMRIAHRIQV